MRAASSPHAYDQRGRLIETVEAAGTADEARTQFVYDAQGNQTQVKHPRHFTEAGKVDDYTVKMHLTKGNIGVPEHLYHYPANIVHRSFEGDFLKQPIGTGPFTLAEFTEGERPVLKRRSDYWKMGEDGQSLPYLDEITYVSMAKDAAVAAVQSGQVDCMYQPRASDWQALKDVPNLQVLTAPTAVTSVLRMRVDLDPWKDVKVRTAMKKVQDHEKLLQLAYYGQGDLPIDAHIAPVHPELTTVESRTPIRSRYLVSSVATQPKVQTGITPHTAMGCTEPFSPKAKTSGCR